MTDIVQTLVDWTSQGHPVAVATIVTNEGSTPRTAGAKMLLGAQGLMQGTVGGGLVEAGVLRKAADTLAGGQAEVLDFDLTGELAAGADMICGGRLKVFLERVNPGPDADIFKELARLAEAGQDCLLATPLAGGPRSLLAEDGRAFGAPLPAGLQAAARQAGQGIQAPVVFDAMGQRLFLEPFLAPAPLYIAGGGHVSLPTAHIAAMVGFRVVVLDDRPEFANASRFPWASEISTRDMAGCLTGYDLGPKASVVIVTRGHVHDAVVLAQALRTRAGYVGMIGSRRKRDAVYDRLRKEGFTDADFARVRCPIGLAIDAQTPEEIAVSIVAELIAARAARVNA